MQKFRGVFFLMAFAVALLAGCSSGLNERANTFYTAVAKGDADKALPMITLPTQQIGAVPVKYYLQLAIMQLQQRAAAHGGLDKVEILKIDKIGDDRALVTARTLFKDGTFDQSIDRWMKTNGKWMLAGN